MTLSCTDVAQAIKETFFDTINIRSSKTGQAKKFYDSFLVFLKTTLFALLPPVQEIIIFFAPVPAVKLPLLPKSCVHMFISLFSEIFSHKMNKLK